MPLSTSATPTTPSAAVTDWQLSAIEVLTESGLMFAHSSALLFKPPAKLRGWRGLIAQCRQMTDTPGHLHNHEHGDRVDRDLSESPRPGRYIYKAIDGGEGCTGSCSKCASANASNPSAATRASSCLLYPLRPTHLPHQL
ncbi:hypothetical protein MVLG_04980 [Microbotryum lychnidis-dioicae p1A1 Lamole]|uniref:Uncharacterized protein n=1 Tax=Microbotryum lychnidis-dioicae (strain p1A1 Lamole / MvSl-1064) TaxID=683840 RepID=U5HCV4_USTV1|nr:hypothetical protein MVLG_04980 [Microbotryum lychnidis-dioicae p1A1 Lamole]|eukprot:KDE04600.1 hypothetical protein MVLG_04980 [Microbotryum lychnidis-dioicae p1A1 Lamole]